MQIPLRQARELCGCTLEKAAILTHLSIETIDGYEIDFEDVPLCDRVTLLKLYGASSQLVFPGTEADCIKANIKNMRT